MACEHRDILCARAEPWGSLGVSVRVQGRLLRAGLEFGTLPGGVHFTYGNPEAWGLGISPRAHNKDPKEKLGGGGTQILGKQQRDSFNKEASRKRSVSKDLAPCVTWAQSSISWLL